jgi:ABC-2 type transport system permease protein
MMSTLKAEFRKVVSLRSTYALTAVAMLIVVLFAFYIKGYKASAIEVAQPGFLALDVTRAIVAVAIFGALVGMLLITHEYRYNTILYTLTAAKSRSRVLLAKIIVVTVFAVLFSILIAVFSPLMGLLGTHLHGLHLAHQSIPVWSLLWHTVFYGWGLSMMALLFGVLVRSQVVAIVLLFILPGTLESLLGLLLKSNQIYLPFTALQGVVGETHVVGHQLTPVKSAGVFLIYLVIGWIVAWVLFQRRDAS